MWYLFRRYSLAGLLLGCVLVTSPVLSVYAAPAGEPKEKSPLEKGINAIDHNEYAKAFSIFSGLAKAGNAEAQHNLAMLYRSGKGVEKDLAESFKWFQQAAEQGIPDAQYYLGYMYDNGEGIEQNLQKAFEWYRKAAEKGQGLAQINLGVIYANGLGVPQDVMQAYLWFHAAAAQGYQVALENRMVIENALKEQGAQGEERLEHLKEQARGYFQQYVQPFIPERAPRRRGMAPPPGH